MDDDARSRRASAGGGGGDGAGGGKKVDPKDAVLLCCRVLRAAGVGSLSAELLRRAKFDQAESVWPLWQALHDLLLLSAPRGGAAAEGSAWGSATAAVAAAASGTAPVLELSPHAADGCAVMRQMWAQLHQSHAGPGADGAAEGELSELIRGFVSHHLACRGYGAAEAWSTGEAVAAAVSAKELLLALGWLLAQVGSFARYRAALVARLAQLTPMLPPYPQTASALPFPPAGLAAAEASSRRVAARVARCLQAPPVSPAAARRQRGPFGAAAAGTDEANLSALRDRAAQLLAEHGRLQLTARELGALQSERVKLGHRLQLLYRKLHQVEEGVPTPRDYSPYELRLLVDPRLRERHALAQSEASRLLDELRACDEWQATFWRWLLALLPPAPAAPPMQTDGGTECGVQPTRQHLLEQLASMEVQPEPEPPPHPLRVLDVAGGVEEALQAVAALEVSLAAKAGQIEALRDAQAARAGGVEGVGTNLTTEDLEAAEKSVRQLLPNFGRLLEQAIAELQQGGDGSSGSSGEEAADSGSNAEGYRPSGLVRLAEWSAGPTAPVEVVESAASKRGEGRQFVPHVKPPKKTSDPYAGGGGKGRAKGGGGQRNWEQERENARLQRSLQPASGHLAAGGKAAAARMVASERSAALEAEMDARLAAGDAAQAGSEQRSAILSHSHISSLRMLTHSCALDRCRLAAVRQAHLAELRAAWDEYCAAHPESELAALE